MYVNFEVPDRHLDVNLTDDDSSSDSSKSLLVDRNQGFFEIILKDLFTFLMSYDSAGDND